LNAKQVLVFIRIFVLILQTDERFVKSFGADLRQVVILSARQAGFHFSGVRAWHGQRDRWTRDDYNGEYNILTFSSTALAKQGHTDEDYIFRRRG
jgi:hypothetical protein